MIQIGASLISDELLEEEFLCNLSSCKGACCVEGDSGAPLEVSELETLEQIYPKILPYMRSEGIAAVQVQGKHTVDDEGDLVTPLVGKKGPCAYAFFEKNGTAKCAIEKAYDKGEISFKKPISCHLYPVRIEKYTDFLAVNYDRWHICNPACTLGASLQLPLYRFLKEALIRHFGSDWYEQLVAYAQQKNTDLS